MPEYRVHDTTGDDLGTVEHPAPNVEPGDVVVLPDGREVDGGDVAYADASAILTA